ncbi:MAG: PD-(D/E)XK nuclease family protein, partial [Oscillospiraceae bacterium]|nr:PD-(D/E)XK nuclease family protein [Oscillospiraceae bacterium]
MLERKLCEVGGDSISRYAEILGFSRLAVRVFSEYGGIAETETDSAGQLLTMSLTVEQLRSRLKLYGSKSLKPNFLLQLATTLDELRCSCISPDLLRSRIGELEGAFAVKMEELALLMEGYDSVCANLGQNPDSKLTRLLLTLEQNDFARDKRFCFYGFTDFNGIEMEIISQILADGGEACVYLLCDRLNSDEQQFSTAAETGRDLMKLARKTHTPYEIFTLSSNKSSEDLSFLRGNLFGVRQVESEEADRICFLSAADIATECRIAAGEILRLLENGVRLRDITVACADYDSYRAPLKTVLHRAEIPAYFAGDTNILKQPVVHMLLSALAAVTDFDRDEILNYMKSGFTGLGDSEADKLENYILLWNIEGKRFEEHWTMSTLGLQDEKESLKQLRLAELNKSRVALMKPLLHLRHGLFGAKNTGEMLLALNRFMDEISLNEKLNSLAIELSKQQKKQKAQEYAQVYGIICRLMEQMYGVLGETIRTVDDFTLLFRTAVSLYTVGTIPATIDCVNVGSLSSQRNSDTPYLFVLGANEGAFPTVGSNQTLLSDRERQQLIRLDIGISPNTVATGRLNRELAIIDSVLGGPVRKLYISAIRGRESHLYLRSRNLFPYGECIETEEALLCRSSRDHDAKYGKTERYTISDLSKDAVEALYGKELRLSASKLEKAASCAFSYFLQYGLKAKESQSAEVDASIYGTFVHYVLEHTCRQVQEEKGFHVVTLDRVMEIADALMERFAEEELSELWHSERAEYLFRRNFHEVRYVVKQLYEELSVSEFEPAFFEMLFADTEDAPVRAIPISGPSVKGTLEGKVDRMDLWKQGNRTYYRVIDYKTGHTSFNYTNVYYGLGMQMLIYLFAIKEYGDKLPY